MTKPIKLAVSGNIGSFSEEAGLLYATTKNIAVDLAYLIDMEGVLAAVENKQVDLGILPVVNLRGGLVQMAFAAMGRHRFQVIDELWLDVRQCLMVKENINLNEIRQIVSHPQALAQCRDYLQKDFAHAELVEWCDTAQAAKDLAQDIILGTSAVIAPKRAAEVYGLQIIAESIQDHNPNLTAFIIVKAL